MFHKFALGAKELDEVVIQLLSILCPVDAIQIMIHWNGSCKNISWGNVC